MAQRRQLNRFTKERIFGMLEYSRTQTEVSRILKSVISRLWQRFQRTGDVIRQSVQVDQDSQPLAKTDICLHDHRSKS
ncbi:UNVERIFIED_CONTAM: hypothetical protein NCL1_36226 [Trichonephila clavipes]